MTQGGKLVLIYVLKMLLSDQSQFSTSAWDLPSAWASWYRFMASIASSMMGSFGMSILLKSRTIAPLLDGWSTESTV